MRENDFTFCMIQVMLKILDLVYDIKADLHNNYRVEV